MSKQATKTNNDQKALKFKIELRLMSLPDKKEIKVLEAFGGEGVLWDAVKKKTDKKIRILSIDKNDYEKVNLKGDNLKFLKSLDLNYFDIIDLDSWGSPVEQLLILQEKKYRGIVHCTFIQTMFGGLSMSMLTRLGYTEKMIRKIPTLFNRDGMKKMEQFLATVFGIEKITIYSQNKKNYFWFIIA